MCLIRTCDLGGLHVCFDERRFVMLLSSRLSADERVVVARNAFEAAGMEQIAASGVYCICGLAADIPAPPRWQQARRRLVQHQVTAAAIIVLAFWLVSELSLGL